MSWSASKVKAKWLERIRYFHHDSASLPKILIEQKNQKNNGETVYPKCLVRKASSLCLIHSLFINPFHPRDVNRSRNAGLFTVYLASGKNLYEQSWGERQPEPKECMKGVPGWFLPALLSMQGEEMWEAVLIRVSSLRAFFFPLPDSGGSISAAGWGWVLGVVCHRCRQLSRQGNISLSLWWNSVSTDGSFPQIHTAACAWKISHKL